MSSFNRVILIGRLTADVERKSTTTGKTFCTFRLAVDRRVRKTEGVNNTDFIPIIAWEKLGDLCSTYLHKGKLVCIEGRLQTRVYEGEDGKKRSAFDVVAEDMRMLSPKSEGGYSGGSSYSGGNSNYGGSGYGGYDAPAGSYDDVGDPGNLDMDVPF